MHVRARLAKLACQVSRAIRETLGRPDRRVSPVRLACRVSLETPETPERPDLRERKARRALRVLMASLLRH